MLIAPLNTEPAARLETEFTEISSADTYSLSTTHFDTRTAQTKTYRQIIEKYLTHPDAQGLDREGNNCARDTADYLDPIHLDAFHIEYIGKEADGLGQADPASWKGSQRHLWFEDPSRDRFRRWVLPVLQRIGPTTLARETGVSVSAIVEILGERSSPHSATKAKLTATAVRFSRARLHRFRFKVPRDPLAALYAAARCSYDGE